MRSVTWAQRNQLRDFQRAIQLKEAECQALAEEASAAIGVAPTGEYLFDVLFNKGDVDECIARMGYAIVPGDDE